MSSRFLMAVCAMLLWFGPPPGNFRGAGPPFLEEFEMVDVKKGQDPTPNPASGNMRAITIPLKDLPNPADPQQQDEHGHRFVEQYTETPLSDVMESLKQEKQMEPVQVFKDKDGKWKLIAGHRRVAAMFILAAKGAAGFSLDMAVQATEILNASPQDLLVRSISDNELGKKLEPKERLVAVQRMHKAEVPKKRGAIAIGMSEKSFARDLRIVEHQRVLDHVLKDHLPPTAASALVDVAVAKGRLDEFLDYFDAWVQSKQARIAEMDRLAKAETGNGLKPNAMLVMNHLEPHIVRGWLEALAKGNALTEEKDLGFEATFDKRSAVAVIKVRVDAKNDPVTHLARVAGQVSKVAQHLAAFAQKRHELEAPMGPQAALQNDDTFLDLDLLRTFGLDDVALELEQELRGTDKSAPWAAPAESADDATAGT